MKNTVIFLLGFFCLGFSTQNVFSQTEKGEKAFFDFTNGVGFISPDSTFKMNVRFRLQNRAAWLYENHTESSEIEATIKRCRLRFDGFINNPNLTYVLQLSFSRNDLAINEEYVHNILRDAMIFYRFNNKFYIGFGQTKLPGNRQRIISSGMQQFADRSIVDAGFYIDMDFGIMGFYSDKIGFLDYNIKTAITTGEGRNVIVSDENLAYTGRIELLPLGRFTNNGDFFEGDLEREKKPKLALAATYSKNLKANKTDGQRGKFSPEQRDITSIFADMLVKYNGWSLYCEYARKIVDNPLIETYLNPELEIPLIFYAGQGYNAQLGYLFLNELEIAARFSHIKPDKSMPEFHRFDYNYGLGITKYINKHKTKLQFNLNYFDHKYPHNNTGYEKFGAVFQVEIGI